jgi:hypothetical protein
MSGFHFFGKGLVSLLKGLFPCDMDNLSSFPLIGSSFPKKNHSPSERLPFPSQEKGVEESPFTVIKYSEPPPEQISKLPNKLLRQTNKSISLHLISGEPFFPQRRCLYSWVWVPCWSEEVSCPSHLRKTGSSFPELSRVGGIGSRGS